jgi:hypothetical protein
MHDLPNAIVLTRGDAMVLAAEIDIHPVFDHGLPKRTVPAAFQHVRTGIFTGHRPDDRHVALHDQKVFVLMLLQLRFEPGKLIAGDRHAHAIVRFLKGIHGNQGHVFLGHRIRQPFFMRRAVVGHVEDIGKLLSVHRRQVHLAKALIVAVLVIARGDVKLDILIRKPLLHPAPVLVGFLAHLLRRLPPTRIHDVPGIERKRRAFLFHPRQEPVHRLLPAGLGVLDVPVKKIGETAEAKAGIVFRGRKGKALAFVLSFSHAAADHQHTDGKQPTHWLEKTAYANGMAHKKTPHKATGFLYYTEKVD